MMATPADLHEMAHGFLVGEGLIARDARSARIRKVRNERGWCVNVRVAQHAILRWPRRSMAAHSGCGLCGLESVHELTDALPDHMARQALSVRALALAFDRMREHQPLKAANRSVHAAAFALHDGTLIAVREDVGRHNALDKLTGALLHAGVDPSTGFAALTSRCSYELVQKAAFAGLGGLATLSAPTGLALRMARAAGLPLACRAPGGIAIF